MNLDDDYNCEEVYQIANQLADAIHEVNFLSNYNLLLKDFTLLTLQYYHDCYTKDYSKALATLNQIDALKNKYSNLSTELIRNHVYEWKTSLYIELGQIDSAQFYIKKLEKIPQFMESQKVWLYKHKAKLALLDDNGLEANKWLEAALNESENIQNLLASQMDDLLYTQTEGEHYLIALKNSEIKRLQKNRWILIISIVSVILILGITLYWIYKENKLKKRINELNEASEFQIILMEQIEEKIRNEERELLSQNLHDDLAGSLIAIKNNLEVYSQEYSSLKLKELSEYVAQTYLNVRNKSHLLNEIANMSNEKIFSNHIIKLANIAFPSPIYKFKFLLDPNCLDHTSLILKSDLLRVINELFSNIIKHSKSTEVELLFYREIDGLYISVKNNKVFFNNNKNFSNKGLHFINKRLKKYNAVVNYKWVNQSFEIIIYIPHSNLYT